MSTLTIFLCAAAFFTAQTIASSENQEKDVVIRQIDQAIEKINASATQVFRRVAKLRPPDEKELRKLHIAALRTEAYDHLEYVRTKVEHYMQMRRLNEDKKKECQSHHVRWSEDFFETMWSAFDVVPMNARYWADLSFGELLHVASENKIALENLKLRVNVCNTTERNDISKNAENIATHFLAAAEKAQKFYEGVLEGTFIPTTLKRQYNWDAWFNEGMAVVRKVYECVQPVVGIDMRTHQIIHGIFD